MSESQSTSSGTEEGPLSIRDTGLPTRYAPKGSIYFRNDSTRLSTRIYI